MPKKKGGKKGKAKEAEEPELEPVRDDRQNSPPRWFTRLQYRALAVNAVNVQSAFECCPAGPP